MCLLSVPGQELALTVGFHCSNGDFLNKTDIISHLNISWKHAAA